MIKTTINDGDVLVFDTSVTRIAKVVKYKLKDGFFNCEFINDSNEICVWLQNLKGGIVLTDKEFRKACNLMASNYCSLYIAVSMLN